MKTLFKTLARARSAYPRPKGIMLPRVGTVLAVFGAAAAFLPLCPRAFGLSFGAGVRVIDGVTTMSDNNSTFGATTAYGPSLYFEQNVTIHEDGTADVESYLNDQHVHPGPFPLDNSFAGAGDYYWSIGLSGTITSPAFDENGDPYIELYDGSTGDGPQPAQVWYSLDGSHSATIDSDHDFTVSFSGVIHFDDSDPSWGTSLSWTIIPIALRH